MDEIAQLQLKAVQLRRFIESGYGRTNKPISRKRLVQMKATLDAIEAQIERKNLVSESN